jgi:hypothetical protein
MYKNLERKKQKEKEYGKKYRARKSELLKTRQEEMRRKIAVAIVAMEMQRGE